MWDVCDVDDVRVLIYVRVVRGVCAMCVARDVCYVCVVFDVCGVWGVNVLYHDADVCDM